MPLSLLDFRRHTANIYFAKYSSELNILKIYSLFAEQFKADSEQWVKEGVYRNVFCSEFNLSFHHPRKDACAKCSQFENSTEEEKMMLKQQ